MQVSISSYFSNDIQYDFDTPINRKNTYSSKWDFYAKYLGNKNSYIPDNVIPMWIADRDFKAAPSITDALKSVVEHGIYGYSDLPPDIEKCIVTWLQKEHAWAVKLSSILYTSTAMTGLHFVLQSLTEKGDTIVTHEPTYLPIFKCIQDIERQLEVLSLKETQSKDSSCKKHYSINFLELEAALKNARVFVLCNPHNPTGTVWSYEDLTTIITLCKKHNVIICSDDVHLNIVYTPHIYKPIERIAQEIAPEFLDNIITLLSPNKTFNTNGIKILMMIVPDKEKRTRIAQYQKICLGSHVDIFEITSMRAAYTYGSHWKKWSKSYAT